MVTTVKRFTQHEGYVTQATTDERLQSAVRDEMGRVARVRKVIHVQEGFAAESFVPLDRKTCTRIIRLFSEFQLSEQEASDEDFVLTMARSAARSLARAEDLVLLEGTRPARQHNVFKSGSVKLDPPSADNVGLFAAARRRAVTNVRRAGSGRRTWGRKLPEGILRGIDRLEGRGFFGPFGLLLHPKVYRDAYTPGRRGRIGRPMRTIKAIVDTIAAVPDMPRDSRTRAGAQIDRPGVILPVRDGCVEIIMAEQARCVYSRRVAGNLLRYCVCERFALRIRNPKAIQLLNFS